MSRLIGKIVAFTDYDFGVVVQGGDEHDLVIVDTIGRRHKIPIKELSWGRKQKHSILAYLYGEKCLACGQTENLSIDHVKRRPKGGSGLENLQLLCKRCNEAKGTLDIDYRPSHPASLFKWDINKWRELPK